MKHIFFLLSLTGVMFGQVERMNLSIPDSILKTAKQNVGYAGKNLGYASEEMAHFGASKYRLRTVNNLFRDAADIPRFTGRVSDRLLADPSDFALSAACCYSFLDASAGRGISDSLDSWWADWVPDSADVDEVFEGLIDLCKVEGIRKPVTSRDHDQWEMLPEVVQGLVVRLTIASLESRKILIEAFNADFIRASIGNGDPSPEELSSFASAPWQDSVELVPRESFQAMDKVDIPYLAYGSIHYLKLAESSINSYRRWADSSQLNMVDFTRCEIKTPWGTVLITGNGSDEIAGNYLLSVDLGGDDVYQGRIAATRDIGGVCTVVDLAGDDTYASDLSAGLASGVYGIGALFDLAGNDSYQCPESGIGSAWFGTGILLDYQGEDEYITEKWGQGAAHAGVGILTDLQGNDSYQALPERFSPESGWNDNPVSLVMGCAFGRRADFGDGHSMAGGMGMLVEGGGDDSYKAYVFALGSGYWWGLGWLEDAAGNDSYCARYYSYGGAAHFALGCLVDRTGDDEYGLDEERNGSSFGHGRDGSIAVFFEGEGNDTYRFGHLAAGSSNLTSIGLFWERAGDDTYTGIPMEVNDKPLVFGTGVTDMDPKGSFRDALYEIGVFLDTGGDDDYSKVLDITPHQAKNDSQWNHFSGYHTWGFGMDTEYF